MDEAERMLRRRAKVMMRRRFRSQRAALPSPAVAERSKAVCARLLALEEVSSAKQIALFWPIERFKEVDLRAADEALRKGSSAVAYPAIDPESREMTFHLVASPEELSPSELGFMAPSLDAPRADALDVVVVPGLAFDPRGYRIGYGGGFYDRAIPTTRPRATAIGVAFDFQLAADVPNEEMDVPVDRIVTDQRELVVGRAEES